MLSFENVKPIRTDEAFSRLQHRSGYLGQDQFLLIFFYLHLIISIWVPMYFLSSSSFFFLHRDVWRFAFPRRLTAWPLGESTWQVELAELQHSLCTWPTTPTKPHHHHPAFSSFCRPVVSSTAATFSMSPASHRPALSFVLCARVVTKMFPSLSC